MSTRFEVFRNGKRVCLAGIRGDGVLSVGLSYTNRESDAHPPDCDLHVGGMGYYHPSDKRMHHVQWPAPARLNVGDEITVRLLPPGEFEFPIQMLASPSATLDDPDFGQLVYNLQAWDGGVMFPRAPFTHAHVHLLGPDSGPTDEQRALFKDLLSRFDVWWPLVAQALCKCHSGSTTLQELDRLIHPRFCIDFDDSPTSLNLTFDLSSEWDENDYCVRLRDWEVVAIWGGE